MEQQQPVPAEPAHSVDPHEHDVLKKYDLGPPKVPLADLLEDIVRDWIANGVPYTYVKRHGGKKRTDGAITVRYHTDRRPIEPAEVEMIIRFIERQQGLAKVGRPITSAAKPEKEKPSVYRPGKPEIAPTVLIDAANGRFTKRSNP